MQILILYLYVCKNILIFNLKIYEKILLKVGLIDKLKWQLFSWFSIIVIKL